MPSMHQSVVTGGVSARGEVDADGEGEAEGESGTGTGTGTGTGETGGGVGLGARSPWQAVRRRRVSQRARTREAWHGARFPFRIASVA